MIGVLLLFSILDICLGRNISAEVWDDVRLVDGNTVYEGRVEVKVNGTWGTVCDDGWSRNDAIVVCKQLGFETYLEAYKRAYFGAGTGPILHDNLRCKSREKSLSECDGIHDPSKANCDHSEDAGVRCKPPQLRSVSVIDCGSKQYQCSDMRMCIPARWVCDGQNDCNDQSDERTLLCQNSATCGVPIVAPVSTRVIGGKDAVPGSWPWMASIKVTFPSGIPDKTICGGTLIDKQWILTAAHCFDLYKPSSSYFHVVLGDHNTKVPEGHEQEIPFSTVVIHKDYQKGSHSNDIALIKLNHTVNISSEYVKIACLPKFGDPPFNSSSCYVTGWGNTQGQTNTNLQQAMVPILNSTLCNTWYNNTLSDGMMCAGYQFGGIDACQGDSGGPLSCERNKHWYVTGVVSWGLGCAQAQHPGIYTDVGHYIKWITDVIDETSQTNSNSHSGPGIIVGR